MEHAYKISLHQDHSCTVSQKKNQQQQQQK